MLNAIIALAPPGKLPIAAVSRLSELMRGRTIAATKLNAMVKDVTPMIAGRWRSKRGKISGRTLIPIIVPITAWAPAKMVLFTCG